jgi:hypothetical protein
MIGGAWRAMRRAQHFAAEPLTRALKLVDAEISSWDQRFLNLIILSFFRHFPVMPE